MTQFDNSDFEPEHAVSQTARALDELQLYGYRAFDDEPDPRGLPEARLLTGAVVDMFDALTASFADTRLEPDLEPLLWSAVNIFHRAAERVERDLDQNEIDQQRGQREQDGSEIKSGELERLINEGRSLVERRDAFELMRDVAAEQFGLATGDLWRPRSGSQVNHRHLTSATIDSRDFLNARRLANATVLVPEGTRIAVSGGIDYNDYTHIWSMLDRVHDKHPDMVLLHGGSPKGAELIAAKWADARKVAHIAFKPDWGRYRNAAPFKRNDLMLDTLPAGVIIFPGSGIQDNLADKAAKLGLRVWRTGG